jgi:DUF1009 family protein
MNGSVASGADAVPPGLSGADIGARDIRSPVALIAGSGTLPFAVASSLKKRGIEPIFYAIKSFCDPERVKAFRHSWIPIGRFGVLMSAMRAEGVHDIIFIGSLIRPALSEVRLDWTTMRMIPAMIAGLRGGDDHLLSATAGIFERGGFRLLGLKDIAPDLLMPEGSVTRKQPDQAALSDIARGREVLAALSPFDVGQAVVVIDGHVVSIEDIEGTDGLLARVARLRASGRIRGKEGRGVLVKSPKVGQDLRFDLPALGPRTVEGVAAADLAGIAIVAGYTVVADAQAMTESADRAGIFVTGLPA